MQFTYTSRNDRANISLSRKAFQFCFNFQPSFEKFKIYVKLLLLFQNAFSSGEDLLLVNCAKIIVNTKTNDMQMFYHFHWDDKIGHGRGILQNIKWIRLFNYVHQSCFLYFICTNHDDVCTLSFQIMLLISDRLNFFQCALLLNSSHFHSL